nr:venom allergen 5 [Drosophila kikkawai]
MGFDKIIYRTRWPKYQQKKSYPNPVKPKDYCKANLCPANQEHITCSKQFWSAKCGPHHDGVDSRLCTKKIVTTLNSLRDQVTNGKTQLPEGYPMPRVAWDNELATMAMRVTNQCNDYPVGLCANTMRYRQVGEASDFRNRSTYLNLNMVGFLRSWFEQASKMKPSDVSSFPDLSELDPQFIAFANMINWKVTSFGCGMLNTSKKRFITCLFNARLKKGQGLYKLKQNENRKFDVPQIEHGRSLLAENNNK